MVDALVEATRKAGFPCRKEQGLDDRTRPGDVFVNRLDVDGPGAIDVTVRDPLAPSHPLRPEAILSWHQSQEKEKRVKYDAACRRRGWQFIPFVVDVYGGFGDEAMRLVSLLVKSTVGQFEGWQRREQEATVWQSLSFALAREVSKQLVWGLHLVEEPVSDTTSHQPYF